MQSTERHKGIFSDVFAPVDAAATADSSDEGQRMLAAYFRELRPYSADEIRDGLTVGNDEAHAMIVALLDCDIVRYRTGDEQDEEELLKAEGTNVRQRYQFRFVGIAITCGHAIVCHSKCIRSTDRPERQMYQVLNVIRKLGQENRLLDYRDDGVREDQLTLMFKLLWLYEEYGVYSNCEETHALNGSGVIDWQRTIDMETPSYLTMCPYTLTCGRTRPGVTSMTSSCGCAAPCSARYRGS